MFIKKFISKIRQRKKDKEYTAVYCDILKAVSIMCANISNVDFAPHIRKATEQEVEQLIDGAKGIPPSVPWEGYYVPSIQISVPHICPSSM